MEIQKLIDEFIVKNNAYFSDSISDEQLMEYTTQPFFYSQRATKKRLQEVGIECKTTVVNNKKYDYETLRYQKHSKDGPNRVECSTRNVTVKRQFQKDGKILFRERKKELLDVSVLKFKTKGQCECPNCGAVCRTESYIDGCDYCGQDFEVKDFEPKISSYSLLEDIKRVSKNACIQATVICSLLVIAFLAIFIIGCSYQIGGEDNFSLRQMVSSIYFVPFAIRQLILCGFCFLVIYASVDNEKRIDDADVLTDRVSISVYEFIQNLELRLKTIYLAQNIEEAGVYSITNIEDFVKARTDVVECQLVKIKFTFAQKKIMYTTIAGQATMKVYRLVGNRIKKYYEVVDFECKSRNENGLPARNVLNAYRCKNCGDSVDIVNGGKCQSCGTMLNEECLGYRFTKLEASETQFEKVQGIFRKVFCSFGVVLCLNLIFPSVMSGYNAFSTAKMVFGLEQSINGYYDEVPLPDECVDKVSVTLGQNDIKQRNVTRHIEYHVKDVDQVLEQYFALVRERGYQVYDSNAYSEIDPEYEFSSDYEIRMQKVYYSESGDVVIGVSIDRENSKIILDMKMD